MDDEIQLISDGDGLAIIGEPAAVERFLVLEGLSTQAVELPRLGTVIGAGRPPHKPDPRSRRTPVAG